MTYERISGGWIAYMVRGGRLCRGTTKREARDAARANIKS